MAKQELRDEAITIRLTVAEKERVRQAGQLKFRIDVGLATLARQILLEAVDLILEPKKNDPQ